MIGGSNLLSALALWRRRPLAPYDSLATGLLLVAWIAIQTIMVGFRHWSQVVWWATFLLVTVLAGR